MTTDNRTNEPTEAQVEAAAIAFEEHLPLTSGALAGTGTYWCAECRKNIGPIDTARRHALSAALEAAAWAAQGAAPQAESDPLREALHRAREHFTAIAASGEIRVWEDTGETLGIDSQTRGWAKRGERICFDALATPVLPSSTVDESNSPTLAVIARARDFDLSVGMTAAAHMADAAIGASGLRVDLAAPVLPSSGVDEEKLAEVIQASAAEWGDSDRVNNVLSQYIARAVAEWLNASATRKEKNDEKL